MKDLNRPDVCILGHDPGFTPDSFQHRVINTIPYFSLALYIQRRFYPLMSLGQITKEAYNTGLSYLNVDVKARHSDNCSSWIFVQPSWNTGPSIIRPLPLPSTWDCYPQGSHDIVHVPPVEAARSLVYAARDGTTRSPHLEDAQRLEAYLAQFAAGLNLTYVVLRHDDSAEAKAVAFASAAVVVGPHGGALTNIIYSRTTTAVLELQPAQSMRLCFMCVAHSRGFKSYGVFVVDGWIEIDSSAGYPLDFAALNQTLFALTYPLRRETISYDVNR